jgi:hypothetical protein
MKRFLIITLLLGSLSLQTILADDLEDLGDLADDAAASSDTSLTNPESRANQTTPSQSGLSVQVGGYLKALGYWNEETYSDDLWAKYQALKTGPSDQKINGLNYLGTRMQFKLEAFLEDQARLFTSFNVNFNTAHSLHDVSADSSTSETGSIRLVESYVELYSGSGTTWKIGSQLVTWGYLEGIEVPTDRVNARDYSYKSTEYEDSKLASTGILLTQRMWSSYFDLMYVPIARTNTNLEFQDYLYPGATETPENKPNYGQWATRFSSSLGNLDYALSYVEGLDSAADLVPTQVGNGLVSPTGKKYNRVKSPGLDLQYNFGNLLAKASYVRYLTEDEEGDDLYIKNNWSKYVVGTEFNLFSSTVNLYAGQHLVEDFPEDALSAQTNFLLGQLRERTDFISGHINANFLTGDALNLVLLAAGYWDEDGKPVQANVKATVKYKIANGLEVVFSPSYLELLENIFVDYQLEVKYSF